jgi:hypothetical protein
MILRIGGIDSTLDPANGGLMNVFVRACGLRGCEKSWDILGTTFCDTAALTACFARRYHQTYAHSIELI